MKFINYLESITGIGIYPLISLLIFFAFFMGVGFYIIRGRKEYFDMLAGLPLKSSVESLTKKNQPNESEVNEKQAMVFVVGICTYDQLRTGKCSRNAS